MSRDLGDFQTPPALVAEILKALGPVGKIWPRVLEPTCGRGNFIAGLLGLENPPREIQAFELQDVHVQEAEKIDGCRQSVTIRIQRADIFRVDLRRDLQWEQAGPLLVIGNPPWVTNAALGGLRSTNLPNKTNLRRLRGIDAVTGESNFDLAEHVWIKLLTELALEQSTIAMLCKTTVARNVLRFAYEKQIPIEDASIRKIDAGKWFQAAVDACLFSVKIGVETAHFEAAVYPDLFTTRRESAIGISRGLVVADLDLYRRSSFCDGTCSLVWRQGIKHDAVSVMELRSTDSGSFINRLGEEVDIEPEYVYPLLKSSDLFNRTNPAPRLSVVVPQKKVGEDTNELRHTAPKLWRYLEAYEAVFTRRKSSVFRGRPRFSIFGVGEYSFADYKVAVAGLYKTPRFRVLQPVGGRPIMLDDTCYFLPCRSAEQAAFLVCLLSDSKCLDFIASLTFPNAKRPITKAILQRIDLRALLKGIGQAELGSRYNAELARLGGAPNRSGFQWPLCPDGFLP